MGKPSSRSQSLIISGSASKPRGSVKGFKSFASAQQPAPTRKHDVAACSAEPLAREVLSASRAPMPIALWGLDREEQLRRALPVLVAARTEILKGAEPLAAIAEAGEAGINCEYARKALRLVLHEYNLLLWQTHPATTQSARTRAFDAAIRMCRRVDGKKGGWRVAAAVENKNLKAVGLR